MQEIQDEFPAASTLLRYSEGDVRDARVMRNMMTDDVVGVIHLAAVARKDWCREHKAACFDIAERGTQTVVSALSDLNQRDKGRRWFILGSSADLHHDSSDVVDTLASSKLKAEDALRRHLDELATEKAPGALHAVSLRMSTVYGSVYDHVDRLVPSIVGQALTNQAIQIAGGQQTVWTFMAGRCLY